MNCCNLIYCDLGMGIRGYPCDMQRTQGDTVRTGGEEAFDPANMAYMEELTEVLGGWHLRPSTS